MFAVALFCIACAAYWLWIRINVKTTEPPYISGAWPLVGHIPLVIGDSCKIWNNFCDVAKECDDLGGVAAASFGPRTVYGVTDPDDCLTIATKSMEKDPIYGFGKSFLGHGLVTARYAIWKHHRKLLNPAFSQILLDTFMGVFNRQSKKLVKELEKEVGKRPFDHLVYIRNIALETICLTAFGVDYTDSNLNSKYTEALELYFETLMERFIKPWWHTAYTFKFSKLKKKQDACLEILHNLSNKVLQNSKSKLNGNRCAERSIIPGTKFKPFIDLILELSIEKGAFSDQEIREHVDTILVAGHDTSANVLTFTMTLLGSHPEAQEKVFAEIQEILGGDRDVEKMDLSKLVYMEAVLKESMRLYPIVPLIARRLHQDVKLKNCTLSAGRTCILIFYGLHRSLIWGPDADEFKPERWLERAGRLPSNSNAFAAFSLGKRNCIGKAYALMSMKTTLVHVVRRYRIKADHTKMRLKCDTMLKSVDGHAISIERRT